MDLAAASVDELFALARSAQDEDAYWACVTELHGRAEDRTFKLAEVLCESFAAGERCLGADVLAQLGTAPGQSAAEGPFASDSGRVLMRMLEEDDEPAVLASAAVGLGHLRDERGIPQLAALASHREAEVRRSVVHGLMGHDDDRAVAALIALSADEDPGVRDWATFSLGAQIDRDTPELREALATRLGDRNKEARGEAIAGLARRGDSRALEAALAVAAGPDGRSPTLDEAIVLLGRTTGDPRLLEHLVRLRDDPAFAAEHGEELERALARCRSGPAGAS
jgi:HEAT repeat protein